jgi:hypothetical protein
MNDRSLLNSKSFFTGALFVIIASALLSSCSHEADQTPADVISKDKMVAVLVDIHLAEASADNRLLNLEQMNAAMATRYDALFKKHGITFNQFKASYDYYLAHADVLSEIYAEVVNELSTRDSKVNANRRLPKVVNDSIRNLSIRVPDSSQKK